MQTAQSAQPSPPQLFTRVDAARLLGCSPGWIDQLIARGVAVRSARTAGGRSLFTIGDLEALAKAIGRADRLDPEAA